MKTKYIPYEKSVTINEHRAPTDESIRLLNEMQEKAMLNIVKSIKVNDNEINFVYVSFYEEYISNDLVHFFKFKLNEKEHIIEIKSDRNELQFIAVGAPISKEKIIRNRFVEKLSIAIANEIIGSIPDLFEK